MHAYLRVCLTELNGADFGVVTPKLALRESCLGEVEPSSEGKKKPLGERLPSAIVPIIQAHKKRCQKSFLVARTLRHALSIKPTEEEMGCVCWAEKTCLENALKHCTEHVL